MSAEEYMWTTTSQIICSVLAMKGDGRIPVLVIQADHFCAKMIRIAGLYSVSQVLGKAVEREANLVSTQSCQIMSNGYTLGQTKCDRGATCSYWATNLASDCNQI
jgi:hypothetical protein